MSKLIDLTYHRQQKTKQLLAKKLLLSYSEGKVTAAMPKERIRSIAASIERANKMFEKLKSE